MFNHNEHEIVKAKQMAKDLKINIGFSLHWGDNTYTPKDAEFVKQETGIKFASVKEMQIKTNTKRALGLCKRTFIAPQINYDGTLLGCCILFDKHYGCNIFEQGLEKSLMSTEFQYATRMIRGEVPPIYKFRTLLVTNMLQLHITVLIIIKIKQSKKTIELLKFPNVFSIHRSECNKE